MLNGDNMVELVRNTKGYDIKFILSDEKNNSVDLTDSTILFKMKNISTGTSLSGSGWGCSIVNASAGICKYTFQDGDLATAGNYYAELQITYSSGEVRVSKLDNIKILEDL
jgi:hypothetical protein